MNNFEKNLKETLGYILKSVGNNDLFEKPILINLDNLKMETITPEEVDDILYKERIVKNDEILNLLKECYKNKDIHFEKEEKAKQEEVKEDINPFEDGINVEIEDDTEVLIYLPYESKDDLFEKILELIDIFDEGIINSIKLDTDEKLIVVQIYYLISQNEIFNILQAFGEKTRIEALADALWIIVDDCI